MSRSDWIAARPGMASMTSTAHGGRSECPVVYTQYHMRELLKFFWNSTRGHRLAPWRSPYLRWRMETYSGLKMDKIGFVEFWGFMVRERKQLRRFLKWTAEMDNYARPKPKNP